MQRPSSKGNTLALEDHDIPMMEDHDIPMMEDQQHEAARRPSNPTADGAESDVSSDQTNRARKKAEPVKSACVQCQKRKTKCSGQRPVCRFCSDRNLTCSWDIGDGLTRTADLKRKLMEATGRSENLDTLVDAMRYGSDEVSTMLLARLRLGTSVKDLARGIRTDASAAEQNQPMQSSEPSSQSSESRERQHSSGTSDYPSPTNSSHPFDWQGLGAQIQQANSSNETWSMNAPSYQPTNTQSFLTSDFDQSRMTWRTNNPFFKVEDGALGPSAAASHQRQPQHELQHQQKRQQQQQQQQTARRRSSVTTSSIHHLDYHSNQRDSKPPIAVPESYMN